MKVAACLASAAIGAAFLSWSWALSQPWDGPQVVFTPTATVLGPLQAHLGRDGVLLTGIAEAAGVMGLLVCLVLSVSIEGLTWAPPREGAPVGDWGLKLGLPSLFLIWPVAHVALHLARSVLLAASPGDSRLTLRLADGLMLLATALSCMGLSGGVVSCRDAIASATGIMAWGLHHPALADDAVDDDEAEDADAGKQHRARVLAAEVSATSLLAVHRDWNVAVGQWKTRPHP